MPLPGCSSTSYVKYISKKINLDQTAGIHSDNLNGTERHEEGCCGHGNEHTGLNTKRGITSLAD